MRIDGWHADGFGILRDHEVRGLGDGLTVFLGPNEAGKTTLLAFLRGVLVGYPARGAANHYPPLDGGAHGGRVFLRDVDGEATVERFVKSKAPRVVLPDREERGDDAVRRLLGGVDAGLFRSVLAFSLTELQDLRSLDGEGVRDRIFSAGIAGAGRSARQAAARLDKEAALLLRPRKGGVINDLAEESAAAEALVSAAKTAASRYPALLDEEEEALGRVQTARGAVDSLRESLRRHELLLALWPVYYEGEEARRELASLGPVAELPEDSGERLALVTATVAAASERLAQAEADIAEARRELEARRGALRGDLADLAPRAEDLADRLGIYLDRVAARPAAQAAVDRAAEAAVRRLAALGRDWDEDRLGRFDVSVSRVEEVREWGARLAASASMLDGGRRDYDAARVRLGEAEGERDRLGLLVEVEDPAEDVRLRTEEATLRRLRVDAQEAYVLAAEETSRRSLVRDRERALRAAESAGGSDGGPAVRLFGTLALVALLGAVPLGVLLDPLWAVFMALTGAALGAAAYALRGPRAGRGVGAAACADLREAVEEARADLASVQERVETVSERMASDAQSVGLPPRPGFVDIEARMDGLAAARDAHRRREMLRARAYEAQESAARAADLATRAEALLSEAEEDEARLRRDWRLWKSARGLPPDLGPDGVAEFVRVAAKAQDAFEAREEALVHLAGLRVEIDEWEEAARAVVAAAAPGEGTARNGGAADSIDAAGGEALALGLRRVREACAADRALRDGCAESMETVERMRARLAAARVGFERAEEARAALFREGGVESEAAFRDRIALSERRRGLEEAVAAARRAVEARLGRGMDAAAVREGLATGRIEEWTAEVGRLGEALARAEEEATEAIRLHRDVERSRQDLEASSDVAARELGLGGVRAALETAVRRWHVVTTARVLIEETLAEYSRTRQPPVLAEASAHLARVTGGAYVRVFEHVEGDGFVVVDSGGSAKSPENLSRGTLEQLYLSLRLGLAAEFGRRAGSVPVIMDDVLVNFDPARARATAEVLVSFAADHQVLFFTCHPATVGLFAEVGAGVSVVELGREDRRRSTPRET